MIEHLSEHHGYRNFLYVGGPQTNKDNEFREMIIERVLAGINRTGEKCSLEKLNGPLFSEPTGASLIAQYMEIHEKRNIDVIVAGSDDMAMGIIKYLQDRPDSSWSHCPLTGNGGEGR